VLLAQLTAGAIEGTVRDADGRRLAGQSIVVTGRTGLRFVIRTNSSGAFSASLPYGEYRLSEEGDDGGTGVTVFVAPLQTALVDIVMTATGAIRDAEQRTPGVWTDLTRGRVYPDAFTLTGLLLSREPSSVTEPLDFTGASDNRLGVEFHRGFSWTDVQYRLQGMDATDSYQPGIPLVLPDVQALEAVVVRSGFAQTTSSSPGTEVSLFLAEPPALWHGAFSTAETEAALFSMNLPPPASRGWVRQADQFRWLTRDSMEAGGPLTRWADICASGTGQWSSQAEPLAAPGTNQRSRLLYGNAHGRIQAGERDHFDAIYSGSRIDLSDGGFPAGLEALTGSRMAPSFVLPGGFFGEPETDHFDFFQLGWTHFLSAGSGPGTMEVRYGYSVAHLDTSTELAGQSRIELLGGAVTGAPPLANLAVRTRQGIEAAWQPPVMRARAMLHRIVAGGGWKTSEPRNRFSTPTSLNLVTTNGLPAFVMEFNSPVDSRELVRLFSGYVADHVSLTPSLSLDAGALADFSRGSLPAQSSAAGAFSPARKFAAQPDLIVWNNVSPRAGFAWRTIHGLVLRGTYFRLYAPLAGRYLDFGNPNSLGGRTYQWMAADSIGPFQRSEQGALLFRFGGPYSSISPGLRRPFSDEFDVGAEYTLARRGVASIHLFRRDERNWIAALNAGVPASAFKPVTILDPGPDGIPGTFDDQRLTVYAQNPGTLGQDRYLLTNPAGLRMLNTGFVAEAGVEWRQLAIHASFFAEKSYGPTNPGDAFYENDAGVVGSLFMDPNAGIHAAGRAFGDRAYLGKMQATYRLPSKMGGIEIANVAGYLDGVVFARQLLVRGLPQGPFLVATTVRGSPEGGNRAQYAINWNLRFMREFTARTGRLAVSADVLNVTNAGERLQENDLSGPAFNLRLPVSVQAPRALRVALRYEF
jgi:hypothetical protein